MIAILFALKVRGAILVGILASTVVGLITGMVKFQGVVSAPPSIAPTFLQLQIPNILVDPKMISVIFIFIFLDLFDTVGTLVGVGEQGGFMVDGKLPRARQALLSDAVATSAGALLGTSTVTSYIESASGISAGGRTGLTSIVTAVLMLLALFFNPLIKMVGAGVPVGENTFLYPIVAPSTDYHWQPNAQKCGLHRLGRHDRIYPCISDPIADAPHDQYHGRDCVWVHLLRPTKTSHPSRETGTLADLPVCSAFRSSIYLAHLIVREKYTSTTSTHYAFISPDR